jgi:hypothetical protein
MFAHIDGEEVNALATLCEEGVSAAARASARHTLRTFTRHHAHRVRARPPRQRIRVRTTGAVHDLREILRAEIAGARASTDTDDTGAEVVITWGRWGRRRPRRTVRLGSYDPRSRLIRIHPILDREEVPEWVLRFVIFHELLHHWIPSRQRGARIVHHSAEFREREAAHQDFHRYQAWTQTELPTLMRSGR